MLVFGDTAVAGPAVESCLAMTSEESGTSWMETGRRPPVTEVDGFAWWKVGFDTDAGRDLYLGAGFVQTSVDRTLIRPARAR